ncbi:MAG: hypothetical protein R3E13_09740 [Alphaproteobacteria bacterium]
MITGNETEKRPHAWAVFSGHADLPWLKILRPGFRHCAVLMNDGRRWVTVDPLSNYTEIAIHDLPPEFDLPLWMKTNGYTVIKAPLRRETRPAPFAVYSCVESVKRVLGIHKRLIFTPWQLYRYLREIQIKQTQQPKGDKAWEV